MAVAEITTNVTPLGLISKVNEVIRHGGGVMPVGSIIAYSGSNTPENFLVCDGAAISRTVYAALFAAIGTTYGAGDGRTTFNIPNAINRVLEGGASGGYLEAGLPDITGEFADFGGLLGNFSGAFFDSKKSHSVGQHPSSTTIINSAMFNASLSDSIYGNSTTVQMAAVITKFLIRYQ